jgi:hypothetical protein
MGTALESITVRPWHVNDARGRTGALGWENADSPLDKLDPALAADKQICGDLVLAGFDTVAKVGIQWPGGERMCPAPKEVSREH